MLYISKSTTSKIVHNLVENGYLKKVSDEPDKRVARIYLIERKNEVEELLKEIGEKPGDRMLKHSQYNQMCISVKERKPDSCIKSKIADHNFKEVIRKTHDKVFVKTLPKGIYTKMMGEIIGLSTPESRYR